jgi:hypothetical protein
MNNRAQPHRDAANRRAGGMRFPSVVHPWLMVCWLALHVLATPQLASAAEQFYWRADADRVDADVNGWSLDELLEEVTAATGWQVFVEPDTRRTVSTRFKNLPVGEALARLLGDLNFALLPQSNAPAKLFVFRNGVQDATQLVRPRAEAKAAPGARARVMPNELVVTLKPGAGETIEELARRLGAKIVERLDELGIYRLRFENEAATKQAREALQSATDVASVEDNFHIERPSRAEPLAASSSVPFSLKPALGAAAGRLIVGLIDTPVSARGTGMEDFLLPGISLAEEGGTPAGQLTHGTSMMETILRGVALAQDGSGSTPVKILPVDIYGNNSFTTTYSVAAGIYKAVSAGATVINLSLGSPGTAGYLQTIIQNSKAQGVVFFAAAGNEPVTTPYYPAAYQEVTAVTAGDKRGNLASYANRGEFVDVVGPGTTIVYFNNRAHLVSGTSAATAFVTGMAAGLAAKTGTSVSNVESQVRKNLAFKPAGAK